MANPLLPDILALLPSEAAHHYNTLRTECILRISLRLLVKGYRGWIARSKLRPTWALKTHPIFKYCLFGQMAILATNFFPYLRVSSTRRGEPSHRPFSNYVELTYVYLLEYLLSPPPSSSSLL